MEENEEGKESQVNKSADSVESFLLARAIMNPNRSMMIYDVVRPPELFRLESRGNEGEYVKPPVFLYKNLRAAKKKIDNTNIPQLLELYNASQALERRWREKQLPRAFSKKHSGVYKPGNKDWLPQYEAYVTAEDLKTASKKGLGLSYFKHNMGAFKKQDSVAREGESRKRAIAKAVVRQENKASNRKYDVTIRNGKPYLKLRGG
jgi:hypothetical protein